MRRHILVVCFLLVLMLLFTACSGDGTTLETSGQDNGADTQNIFENTGVVIDTLVDVFSDREVTSTRITQAVFNQPLTILDEESGWSKIKMDNGVEGWVKSKFISRDCASIDGTKYSFKLVVTGKEKKVLSQRKGGIALVNVVMGTVLYSPGKVNNMYEVALPGNITGWLEEGGIIQMEPGERIPVTSASDFVSTVLKFSGTSFITGGVSTFGMDAAGLVYTCANVNGVELPRDLQGQFEYSAGKAVDIGGIKPGDLVFFGSGDEANTLSLVGVYTGDNAFLYANKAKGYITTGSLEDETFSKKLAGIRRIF